MVNLIWGQERAEAPEAETITGRVLDSRRPSPSSRKQEPSRTSAEAANMIHGNIRLSGLRATTLLNYLRQRPKKQEMSSAFWAVWQEAFHLCHG